MNKDSVSFQFTNLAHLLKEDSFVEQTFFYLQTANLLHNSKFQIPNSKSFWSFS